MTNVRPRDGLTIKQLVDALREKLVPLLQDRPADLTLDEALAYEHGINDVLIRARSLVNSFRITIRAPPEVLIMICSYLPEGDLFSASQVCHYWRSVLVSSPSLWIRVSCHRAPRTTASLERCGPLPIKLRVESPISNGSLESVLLHGSTISALTINHEPNQIPSLRHLLLSSRSSLERLHICAERMEGWRAEQQPAHDVWSNLPFLRELFVCRYSIPIEKLNAPNIVHLVLENTGYGRTSTVQNLLDTLRGSPLLETLLINQLSMLQDGTEDHPVVSFPYLRCIEAGVHEVRSGLIAFLDFPQNVSVGFRTMRLKDLCHEIPLTVMDTLVHVLQRLDTRSITIATPLPPHSYGYMELLVRFEGVKGSLEITAGGAHSDKWLHHAIFGPRGVLASHPTHIGNVTELHISGRSFRISQPSHGISVAMPNLTSISFFRCNGPYVFELLAPEGRLQLPFPRVERVMVLGQETGLEDMARRRKELGVPLKTILIGSGDFEYDSLEDYATLEELVDDVRVECPTEVLKWGTGNEILGTFAAANIPEPNIFDELRGVFGFCRFVEETETGEEVELTGDA